MIAGKISFSSSIYRIISPQIKYFFIFYATDIISQQIKFNNAIDIILQQIKFNIATDIILQLILPIDQDARALPRQIWIDFCVVLASVLRLDSPQEPAKDGTAPLRPITLRRPSQ